MPIGHFKHVVLLTFFSAAISVKRQLASYVVNMVHLDDFRSRWDRQKSIGVGTSLW